MLLGKLRRLIIEKVPWSTYVAEFALLFSAVYLGFLAESYRAGIDDRKRELYYVNSLLSDIQSNISSSEQLIADFQKKIPSVDTLIENFLPIINGSGAIYLKHIDAIQRYYDYFPSNSTLLQLQNGEFRTIESLPTVNALNSYDLYNRDLMFETLNTLKPYWNSYWEFHRRISCNLCIDSLIREYKVIPREVSARQILKLQTEEDLNLLYNYLRGLRQILHYYITKHRQQIQRSNELITVIRDEYELE